MSHEHGARLPGDWARPPSAVDLEQVQSLQQAAQLLTLRPQCPPCHDLCTAVNRADAPSGLAFGRSSCNVEESQR